MRTETPCRHDGHGTVQHSACNRWYNAHGVAPKFCFGHGLSYTTFEYGAIRTAAANGGNTTVSVDVTNTGDVAGAEVVQLYLTFPSSAGEPPRQLRGFEKLHFVPAEKKMVVFTLTSLDRSVWDVATHRWKGVAGSFGVLVGASVCDIRAQVTLTIQ